MINAGVTHFSKQLVDSQVKARKELRAKGDFENPAIKSHGLLEALQSITDTKAAVAMTNFIRKSVNSYDIQGRRITSYFDQMYELVNSYMPSLQLLQANGVAQTSDFEYGWRETSPNDSVTPVFFNLNHALPTEAESTEAIRTGTCGAYGNLILLPWVTQKQGQISDLGSYDVKAKQFRDQMIRMQKFRCQKFMVQDEVVSELVGDTPQWRGLYTDSSLNFSALVGGGGGDLSVALINALHVAIANPASIDSLGLGVDLVALTTANQLEVVKGLEIAKYTNAESSGSYLANQARLKAKFPGVDLDPDMVQFFQTTRGAVIAFIHDPFFSAVAANVTFCADFRRPTIVKFPLMDGLGPWVIQRDIPELVDEYVVFDVEGLCTPNRETRGGYTNTR
jgi:hypothetical protein